MKASGNPQPQQTWVNKLCQGDPDLKCPEHDRMSFLLADKRIILELCRDAGWSIEADIKRRDDAFLRIHAIEIGKISLEHPVTKGSGEYQTIIGFADALCSIVVSYFRAEPAFDQEIEGERSRIKKENAVALAEWECRHRGLISRIIPSVDDPEPIRRQLPDRREVQVEVQSCFESDPLLLVEAKPHIPNPMETMRQLKTYRNFFSGRILLWCPEILPTVAKIFRDQEILVATISLNDLEKLQFSWDA